MAKVEKAVVFKSNEVIDYSEGGLVSKEWVSPKTQLQVYPLKHIIS